MPGMIGRSQNSDVFSGSFTTPTVIFGAIIGAIFGAIVGMFILMKKFPSVVPVDAWVLFWLVVALSAALGAAITVAVYKNSDLRDLRSYVDTFFFITNHQNGVDRVLKAFAIWADETSKRAISLRTDGIKVSLLGIGLDTGQMLEEYRKVQEDADREFHEKQAKFYKIFDLAAKFKRVFSLNLKERKFKAYASAERTAETEKAEV